MYLLQFQISSYIINTKIEQYWDSSAIKLNLHNSSSKKNKSDKSMFSFKQRQILSLISGCMIHTVYGLIYTLGAITPYIASHIYYTTDPSIRVVDVSINYPVLMVSQTLGIALSMFYLQSILPGKILCFISIWGLALCVFVSSFLYSLWAYTLVYSGALGMFIGIGYMLPFKNTYSYFPKRKGMCAGICMMGYGIGSFIYNQIFLQLVNPQNDHSNDNHIFPQNVARRFPVALKVLALVYFSIGTVGCILFIKIKPEDSAEFGNDQEGENNQQSLLTQNSTQKISQFAKIQTYFNMHPGKKLCLLKLYLTVFCSCVYGVFITYNYKQYGQTIVNNDSLITLTGSLGCISNSLGRIFWCFLFDYLSFKTIMTILNYCLFACCMVCMFVRIDFVYIGCVIMTYFFVGSFYGIMPTQAVRTFGDEVGANVYPAVFSGFLTASITQFIVHLIVIQKWGNEGFTYAFACFAVVQVTSIVFVRVFRYHKLDKQEKSKLKEHQQQHNEEHSNQINV